MQSLDMKDVNIRKAVAGFNAEIEKMTMRLGSNKEYIVDENQLLAVLCEGAARRERDFDYAEAMSTRFLRDDIDGFTIGKLLRSLHISNRGFRWAMLCWADWQADNFLGALQGNQESFSSLMLALRGTYGRDRVPVRDNEKRMLLVMIYEKCLALATDAELREQIFSFGRIYMRYLLENFCSVLADVYGYELPRRKRRGRARGGRDTEDCAAAAVTAEARAAILAANHRIVQLEEELERSDSMFKDLQTDFDEQLEESRLKERMDFFSMLNSEKYGCLLDELLLERKSIAKLEKQGFKPPVELNGIIIMVKKLASFVRDNHIDPIMKPGEMRELTAAEAEFADYDGTPFREAGEKKQVQVISPGWVYKDKDVQISRPRLKEVGRDGDEKARDGHEL